MENDKCMELIIHSGEAQSYAMEAINQAKNFNFNQAKELMEKAEKEQIEAHKVQTSLIVEMARKKEEGIDSSPIDLLLIHSLDHVASGLISIDFAKKIIENYELIKKLGEHVGLWE